MSASILVIGSTNTDMVVQTPSFPQPGETLLGASFAQHPGGKGANQAVAAARLGGGASVTFLTKVGKDGFGEQARSNFEKEGMSVDHVLIDKTLASGVAFITVDRSGENAIVVASGANAGLTSDDLLKASHAFEECEFLLIQLETPLETVSTALKKAKQLSKRAILNPAPAAALSDSIYDGLFAITPNETEAALLTGIATDTDAGIEASAKTFFDKGVEHVIITLGSRGAYVLSDAFTGYVSVPKVKAADTTAAGDTFNGALAVGLQEGKSIQQAVVFACKAASLSVTKAGAQPSIPTRKEVNQFKP